MLKTAAVFYYYEWFVYHNYHNQPVLKHVLHYLLWIQAATVKEITVWLNQHLLLQCKHQFQPKGLNMSMHCIHSPSILYINIIHERFVKVHIRIWNSKERYVYHNYHNKLMINLYPLSVNIVGTLCHTFRVRWFFHSIYLSYSSLSV